MTHVHWLTQCEADIPSDDYWLSPEEIGCCADLHFHKRKMEWLLGRWTAKRAIASFLNPGARTRIFAHLCVVPGPDGAPVARLDDRPAPVSISISHSAGSALCAVAAAGNVVGCDLELIEPRSDRFLEDYFTDEERLTLLRCRDRQQHATLLWSAKESVLKLVHAGLRLDTRTVSVRILQEKALEGWRPFRAEFLSGATFRGWWQSMAGRVMTVAGFPPSAPPTAVLSRIATPLGRIPARQAIKKDMNRHAIGVPA